MLTTMNTEPIAAGARHRKPLPLMLAGLFSAGAFGPSAARADTVTDWNEIMQATVSVAGRRLVSRRRCASCGYRRQGLRFVSAFTRASDPCPRCDGRLISSGSNTSDGLTVSPSGVRSKGLAGRALAAFGVRAHDVLTLQTATGDWHFEIVGDTR